MTTSDSRRKLRKPSLMPAAEFVNLWSAPAEKITGRSARLTRTAKSVMPKRELVTESSEGSIGCEIQERANSSFAPHSINQTGRSDDAENKIYCGDYRIYRCDGCFRRVRLSQDECRCAYGSDELGLRERRCECAKGLHHELHASPRARCGQTFRCRHGSWNSWSARSYDCRRHK